MRPVEALRRTTGAAAGSTLVLGLLVCGCVFTAVAGPALSLHTRTEALRQSMAGFPSTTNARITGTETGQQPRAWRRPVAEATACAAAVGGLVVLHDQGVPADGGVD